MKLKRAIGLFVLMICLFAPARGDDGKLNAELTRTLSAFAKRNGLSEKQLDSMLGERILDPIGFKQGGVGVIDKDTFILMGQPHNALKIGGDLWTGKDASKPETILINDGHVLNVMDQSVNFTTTIVVFFTPKEVRFVDFSTHTGGRYLR